MPRCTRTALAAALTFVATMLVATGGAQAIVVNDAGTSAGVAMVPGTTPPSGMVITSGSSCQDPWLSSDFGGPFLPSNALCYRGGSVMHSNETFDVTWDPHRLFWASTKDYVEQFLRDVADGSGTFTSPYALTPQYHDTGGAAGNNSLYGGGCSDFGTSGGACQYGTSSPGPGHNYPSTPSCTPTGGNQYCLTDTDIRGEVSTMASQMGVNHSHPGYTPLLVVLLPPSVEACLDSSNTLCSANGTSTAQFCSYHAATAGGVDYVVQPWTTYTGCDEPKLPSLPPAPTPAQLATDAGVRLVNPLSRGQIAAITDPGLTGWVANDGSEITEDDGCGPAGFPYDSAQLGTSSQNPYYIQRETNNGGVINGDPNAYFGCAPNVLLSAAFVVPSSVSPGDVVAFDGSKSVTTLLVPNANYHWSFGDGTGAVGPSVEHVYGSSGQYVVTLTITDRGGNIRSLSQTVNVLGPHGGSGPLGPGGLQVRLQLMPQSLRSVARNGITVQVQSNQAADAITSISITRRAARRAHITRGHGPSVVIGRGTVSGIRSGTATLHLRLSPGVARKLRHLRHVTLTVRFSLVTAYGNHLTIVAAGRY